MSSASLGEIVVSYHEGKKENADKYRVQSTCAFVFFPLKEEASSFDENEVMKSVSGEEVEPGAQQGL